MEPLRPAGIPFFPAVPGGDQFDLQGRERLAKNLRYVSYVLYGEFPGPF